MAADDNSLHNHVWRLEQRQQDILTSLQAHASGIERIEKHLSETVLRIQWLEWHQKETRDEKRIPITQQVSNIDPSMVRIVIGTLLSAVIGLSVGNFAIFGG